MYIFIWFFFCDFSVRGDKRKSHGDPLWIHTFNYFLLHSMHPKFLNHLYPLLGIP